MVMSVSWMSHSISLNPLSTYNHSFHFAPEPFPFVSASEYLLLPLSKSAQTTCNLSLQSSFSHLSLLLSNQLLESFLPSRFVLFHLVFYSLPPSNPYTLLFFYSRWNLSSVWHTATNRSNKQAWVDRGIIKSGRELKQNKIFVDHISE